jgi:hypothetical protein
MSTKVQAEVYTQSFTVYSAKKVIMVVLGLIWESIQLLFQTCWTSLVLIISLFGCPFQFPGMTGSTFIHYYQGSFSVRFML